MPIIEADFLELTEGLDVEAFWAENERCFEFTTDKPRCAATFSPDDHWIFEFMQVPSTVRYYHDKAYRDGLHREVNAVTLAVCRQGLLSTRIRSSTVPNASKTSSAASSPTWKAVRPGSNM